MVTEILLVLQWVGIICTALLAIDNALDIVAKAFGNKKWDTLLGQWAVNLNTAITATKSVTPVVPAPAAPVAPTQPASPTV